MKLLTHNLLRSNIKGVQRGYPLRIEVAEKAEVEAEFNAAFVVKMLGRLDWAGLRQGARDVAPEVELPEQLTEALTADEAFLRKVHVLLEVVVLEGNLVCPETGRKFPISKGIPNMLLKSDEV